MENKQKTRMQSILIDDQIINTCIALCHTQRSLTIALKILYLYFTYSI